MDDGNKLRVKGEGDAGAKGGPVGDLYVFLNVKSDPKFKRTGKDIYSEQKVRTAADEKAAPTTLPRPGPSSTTILAVEHGRRKGRLLSRHPFFDRIDGRADWSLDRFRTPRFRAHFVWVGAIAVVHAYSLCRLVAADVTYESRTNFFATHPRTQAWSGQVTGVVCPGCVCMRENPPVPSAAPAPPPRAS